MVSSLLTKAHPEVWGRNGAVGSLLENQGGPSKLRGFFPEPRVVFKKNFLPPFFFLCLGFYLFYFTSFIFHIVEIMLCVVLL